MPRRRNKGGVRVARPVSKVGSRSRSRGSSAPAPRPPRPRTTTVVLPPAPLGTNVGELYLQGLQDRIEKERHQTALEAGDRLRGGSWGLVTPEGEITAVCARVAMARFLGAEPPRDEKEWVHKQLMFDLGHGNEDMWADPLKAVYPGAVLREEEFPIEWRVEDPAGGPGVRATGREDLILIRPKEGPRADGHEVDTLCELKQVSSLNTAISVLLKRQPKVEHAVQLANYMLRSGAPGQLWYTNRIDLPVPDWGFITPLLPASIADTAHHAYGHCGWSRGNPERGVAPKVTKLTPFLAGYYLRWHEGVLYWRPVDSNTPNEWFPSIITEESLDAFGRVVLSSISEQRLPPRPITLEIDGVKGGYNKCDYCDWSYLCQRADNAIAQPTEDVEQVRYRTWEEEIARLREGALSVGDSVNKEKRS